MARLPLILIASLCVAFGGCRKKGQEPAENPWNGTVAAIETLNGMTVTFTGEDGKLAGVREGSPVPAGTRVETPAGTRVELSVGDGSRVVVDGGSAVSLDRFADRGLRVHRGRAFVEAPNEGTTLRIGDESVTGRGTFVAEASPTWGSIFVYEGALQGAAGEAGTDDVVALGQKSAVVRSFDEATRLGWLKESSVEAEGYGVVQTSPSNARELVQLVEHLVDTTLTEGFAQTTVTETFRNGAMRDVELSYELALPPGVVPTEVALRENGQWIVSSVEEDADATRAYAQAKAAGRQAIKMEVESGVARVRVANVKPEEDRSIRIKWVERLADTVGGSRFVYRMPRADSDQHRAERFAVTIRAPGRKAEDLLVAAYGAEVVDTAEGAIATFEHGDFAPIGDLSVVLADAAPATVVRQSFANTTYVAVAIRPELGATEDSEADVLVVLDTSDSRRGSSPADEALLQQVLKALPRGQRAMVLGCASTCEPLSAAEFGAAPEVGSTSVPSGNTDASEVLRVAAKVFEQHASGRERHIIYLTDGQLSAGTIRPERSEWFRSTLKETGAKLHVVPLGPDHELARALAAAGGGRFIRPTDIRGAMLSAFLMGSLVRPKLEAAGLTDVVPEYHDAIPPGASARFVGRLAPEAQLGNVTLTGMQNGRAFSQNFPIDVRTIEAPIVSKLWASERISRLSDRKEISELSREHQVPSQYTSFIVTGREVKTEPTPQPAVAQPTVASKPKRRPKPKRRSPARSESKSEAPKTINLFDERSAMLDSMLPEPFRETSKGGRGGAGASPRFSVVGMGDPGGSVRAGDLGERRAYVPRVVPGRPKVTGALDTEIVRRVTRKHRRELKYCYERALQRDKTLGGRMLLRFVIAPTGAVSDARTEPSDFAIRELEACVTAKVRQWVFPEPRDQKPVTVHYSFYFSSSGSTGHATPPIWPIAPSDPAQVISPSGDPYKVAAGVSENTELFRKAVLAQPIASADKRREMSFLTGNRSAPPDSSSWGMLIKDWSDEAILQFVRELAEYERLDVERHERIVRAFETSEPRVACTHRQSVASLRGNSEPDCEPVSDLEWLGESPAKAEPVEPALSDEPISLTARLEGGERARLVLLALDGTMRGWLSFDGYSHCEKLASSETCSFRALPRGLYSLAVLAPSGSRDTAVTVIAKMNDEELVRTMTPKDFHAFTIAVGDVDISPPEVPVPAPYEDGALSNTLDALFPAVAFCVLGESEISTVEVEARLQKDSKLSKLKVLTKPDRSASAERCVADAVRQIDRPKQSSAADVRFEWRLE